MENNVHELKAVENTVAEKSMPLNSYRLTLRAEEYDEEAARYVLPVIEFNEVEIFTVSNGFVVITPKGGNMVAYNKDDVFKIEELPAKEQN